MLCWVRVGGFDSCRERCWVLGWDGWWMCHKSPVCPEHKSEGCTGSEARKLELWSQVNRPESTGAEKQLCDPTIHSLGLGLQSPMTGFLGVIFDFCGFVRSGKENKCRTRVGKDLQEGSCSGWATAHSAMAPSRVSRLLRAVGFFPLQRSEESCPMGHWQARSLEKTQGHELEHQDFRPQFASNLWRDFRPPDFSEFLQNGHNIHNLSTSEE